MRRQKRKFIRVAWFSIDAVTKKISKPRSVVFCHNKADPKNLCMRLKITRQEIPCLFVENWIRNHLSTLAQLLLYEQLWKRCKQSMRAGKRKTNLFLHTKVFNCHMLWRFSSKHKPRDMKAHRHDLTLFWEQHNENNRTYLKRKFKQGRWQTVVKRERKIEKKKKFKLISKNTFVNIATYNTKPYRK